jgi:hypothetical protein
MKTLIQFLMMAALMALVPSCGLLVGSASSGYSVEDLITADAFGVKLPVLPQAGQVQALTAEVKELQAVVAELRKAKAN